MVAPTDVGRGNPPVVAPVVGQRVGTGARTLPEVDFGRGNPPVVAPVVGQRVGTGSGTLPEVDYSNLKCTPLIRL